MSETKERVHKGKPPYSTKNITDPALRLEVETLYQKLRNARLRAQQKRRAWEEECAHSRQLIVTLFDIDPGATAYRIANQTGYAPVNVLKTLEAAGRIERRKGEGYRRGYRKEDKAPEH